MAFEWLAIPTTADADGQRTGNAAELGMTQSTRWTAICAMRCWMQSTQRRHRKSWAKTPHSRKTANLFLIKSGKLGPVFISIDLTTNTKLSIYKSLWSNSTMLYNNAWVKFYASLSQIARKIPSGYTGLSYTGSSEQSSSVYDCFTGFNSLIHMESN